MQTSPFDLVNGITMRGLLEVFDVLVRNQDPDTSRVLYSYLYAKPNATKRLEFLTESAANGIGLDEVSYLFDASMPYGSSTNHTIDDGEGHGEQEFTGEENEDQPDYNTDVDHEVDHEDENGEAYGDYNEGKHSLEAQVKEHDQLAAGQVGGSGEFNAPEDVDAAEEDPTLLGE